jgi:hypothetical protein
MKAGDDQEGIGLNKEKECGGKSLRARPKEGLKDIAKARSLIRDWRIGQIPPSNTAPTSDQNYSLCKTNSVETPGSTADPLGFSCSCCFTTVSANGCLPIWISRKS